MLTYVHFLACITIPGEIVRLFSCMYVKCPLPVCALSPLTQIALFHFLGNTYTAELSRSSEFKKNFARLLATDITKGSSEEHRSRFQMVN